MIEFSIRRPVSVFVLCLGLLVLGLISYQKIPVQLMPTMDVPEFKIVALWKNATPEDIENSITIPIERSISTVSGLKNSSAVSQTGVSEITLKFKSNIDIPATLAELRDKVDSVSLPEGVRKPKISRFQSSTLYINEFLIRSKDQNINLLEVGRSLKETLVRDLEKIDGLALVQTLGLPQEELQISVNTTAMQIYGLTLQGIADAIQGQNKVVQVGQVEYNGKKIPVRMGKNIGNKEDLQNLIIKKEGEKAIRLSDVAKVEVTSRTSEFIDWDSQPALLIQIRKEAEANAVEVGEKVNARLAEFFESNRENYENLVLVDQSSEIAAAVDNVKSSVISGAILAALIIYLLLQSGWTSFVISVAIPISLLISLILMYFTGVTFNLMSLAGLALGVGMLVDNSTIVLESIGLQQLITSDKFEAALFGTKKVSAAIVSSTLSTVAVFAPLVFIEGEIGFLFRDVALTICYSILASLVVAILVIPVLSTKKPTPKPKKNYTPPEFLDIQPEFEKNPYLFISQLPTLYLQAIMLILKKAFVRVYAGAGRALAPSRLLFLKIQSIVLNSIQILFSKIEFGVERYVPYWLNRLRMTSILVAGSVLVGWLLISSRGAELFPEEHTNKVQVNLSFNPAEIKDSVYQELRKIEQSLRTMPGVEEVVAKERLGNSFELTVMSKPQDLDKVTSMALNLLSKVPDLKYDRKKLTVFDDKKPVQILVQNDDLKELTKLSNEIQARIQSVPGLVDVDSNLERWTTQLLIEVKNQKANFLGLDIGGLVGVAKNQLDEIPSPTLQFGDKMMIGRIEPVKYNNLDPEELKNMSLVTEGNKRLYFGDIASLIYRKIPSALLREDRQRVSVVQANLNQVDLETVIHKIEKKLKGISQWRFGGQREQQKQSNQSLVIALILSTLLIYLITASQFESLIQPLVVLVAVPLSVLGVGIFLILFDLNFSSLVLVGFIILVGASVNTSIVMVDFANQLFIEGQDAKNAILTATKKRMRPIVVTTAANILGLVPMAFSFGEPGSSMQQPLSVTLIGGLISSTILTVIAVPAFYVWIKGRQKNA